MELPFSPTVLNTLSKIFSATGPYHWLLPSLLIAGFVTFVVHKFYMVYSEAKVKVAIAEAARAAEVERTKQVEFMLNFIKENKK